MKTHNANWSYVYDENKRLLDKYFNLKGYQGRCHVRLCKMPTGHMKLQLSGNNVGFHSIDVTAEQLNSIAVDFPFIETYEQ